jgi:dienelactone hydrolase
MQHFPLDAARLPLRRGFAIVTIEMRNRYAKWMYDWKIGSPRWITTGWFGLESGVEWAHSWPCRNGISPGQMPSDPERSLPTTISASSPIATNFIPIAYRPIRLERREVKVFSTREVPDPRLEEKVRGTEASFLSWQTPYPRIMVNARWFPSRGRRAVVLLPHWNADAISYTGLCKVLNMLGVSVLRLSMPHHDIRMAAEISRADYAVSANIGRTLDAVRQGVIDIRCCLDWLEQQGYRQLGLIGTSLGSCYAFIASAHDARVRAAAFNHASTYFADVLWHGQTTRHIRQGIEATIDLDRLRKLFLAASPMVYFDKFARHRKRSLVVYANYDLTFLPEFSREVVDQFAAHHLDHKVVVLPCGHYTTGETPYKYMDGWHLASFFRTAFEA